VELSGTQEFPPIGDLPYFITLGPYGFYWFSLEHEPDDAARERPRLTVRGRWDAIFEGANRQRLEAWLPSYIQDRRWFAHKTRTVTAATIVDTVAVPFPTRPAGGSAPAAHVLIVQIDLDLGNPERYLVPLAYMDGTEAEDMRKWHPEAIVADLRVDGPTE